MSIVDSLLTWFRSLFVPAKKPLPPPAIFQNVPQASDWREGKSLYAGYLPLTRNKIHYLECKPIGYADRHAVWKPGIPTPTHTISFYYYKAEKDSVRTTIFVDFWNCNVIRDYSPDWIAVKRLMPAVFNEIMWTTKQERIKSPVAIELDLSPISLLLKGELSELHWKTYIASTLKNIPLIDKKSK